MGLSNKSLWKGLLGRDGQERNAPTLAATVVLYGRGVRIHRVHEVRETRDALVVAQTLGMRGEKHRGAEFHGRQSADNLRDILDILLVGYIFFRVILLIKGTRAVSVIYGLLLIVIAYFAAGEFGLYTLNWLLGNFLGSIFLVVIILFRRDIRKALAVMGATTIFKKDTVQSVVLDDLILALVQMAKNKTGALVVHRTQHFHG